MPWQPTPRKPAPAPAPADVPAKVPTKAPARKKLDTKAPSGR
jgi:hypothetical protein